MTAYARIENSQVAEYPLFAGDIKLRFKHVSFPRGDFHPPEGFVAVAATAPPEVDHAQDLSEAAPELVDGVWTQRWSVSTVEPGVAAERLAAEKEGKRRSINTRRDALESSVAATPHGTVDADPTSAKRLLALQGACLTTLLTGSAWEPLGWTMADNSQFVIDTPAKGLEIAGAVTAYAAALHAHASALKAAVDAAATFADLAAIDVEAGWP